MKISWILFVSALLYVAACKKSDEALPAQSPVITGFTPSHGGYNTSVTIRGLHFGAAGSGETVKINGIAVPVFSATDTSITVQVPPKAADGKISITSGGQTIESSRPFLYDYAITVSSFAGDGTIGYADGQGPAAKIVGPAGITIDAQDNLYVAGSANSCVRKITPQGLVSTFAGSAGTSGYADGTGNAVRFGTVLDIKYEKTKDVFYVIDNFNAVSRIRKITSNGEVSTVAGGGSNTAETVTDPLDAKLAYTNGYYVRSLAIDANKNIYVIDEDGHLIRKINSSGITTLAGKRSYAGYQDGQGANALFSTPDCVATANDGNLLVFDAGNHRIRKVTPAGLVSTFAGKGSDALADADNLQDASFTSNVLAFAQDSKGIIYMVDEGRLRLVTPQGRVVTLTSNRDGYADGDGSTAKFSYANGIVADSHDNLFISDTYNNRIRKVVIQ